MESLGSAATTPLSDEAVLQAIAHNHRMWFARNGADREPGLVVARDEVTIGFPKGTRDEQVALIERALLLAREREIGKIGCWSAVPSATTPELAVALLARGFQWGWEPCWMVLDLTEQLPVIPVAENVVFQRHYTPLDTARTDLPYHDPKSPLAPTELLWQFSATQNGAVVGQAVVQFTPEQPEVAGVYSVGVVPSARRQGIGRALSRLVCEHARERGCRYVTLNAATPIYDKLGFRRLGMGQTWWLFSPTLTQTPLPAEDVAWTEALGAGDTVALERLALPKNLDAPLPCGQTPLELTAALMVPQAAQWLLDHGATPEVLPLYDLGWHALLEDVLKRRPELAGRPRVSAHQETPLHAAVLRNDRRLAERILAARPDLTRTETRFNATALGWARHLGRTELAAMIETAGGV